MPPRSTRVSNACQRCKRQKLKCDTEKPCTLCLRAGVQCTQIEPRTPVSERRRRHVERQSHTHTQVNESRDRSYSISTAHVTANSRVAELSIDQSGGSDTIHEVDTSTNANHWTSSSTLALVDEAIQQSESDPLQNGGVSLHHDESLSSRAFTDAGGTHPRVQALNLRRIFGGGPQYSISRRLIMELISLLPPFEAANILINTYFDRIHWFLLLFHQEDFRSRFQRLYNEPFDAIHVQQSAFVGVVLAVCAISIPYLGSYRACMLKNLNVDPDNLKTRLLELLGQKLLEIVALGSIESVQTCVLLGTYYLYHGRPELAWPVCGCGLRVAQALNLHRTVRPSDFHTISSPVSTDRAAETRKRCWWAIYEIETFCSMLHGLPLGISDADCDIGHLDTHVADQARLSEGQPNLLLYKHHSCKLSVIAKSTLAQLYGMWSRPSEATALDSPQSGRLRDLVRRVRELDRRLNNWYSELPADFHIDDLELLDRNDYPDNERERDIGSSSSKFELYVFRLQALVLKLVYENTRILVHRPLLSYRTASGSTRSTLRISEMSTDPCQHAMEQCHQAALQVSYLQSLSILCESADTYAVASIGMHLLTAGITLCIIVSLDPLSPKSHESKLAIRNLMQMQASFEGNSAVPEQGRDVLKKLISLVMDKELKSILDFPSSSRSKNVKAPTRPASQTRQNEGLQPAVYQEGVSINQVNPGSPSNVQTGLSNPSSFGIYENPDMAQALSYFDQSMQFGLDQNTTFPADSCDPSEQSMFDPEQAWIWNFDFGNEAFASGMDVS